MTELTHDTALETIFDECNKRRIIWTPTILINRMGISRSPIPYRKYDTHNNYDTQARRQAKQILHELWLQGNLLRKTRPDTRNSYLAGAEFAYFRPADAPGEFLVPCQQCQQPCLSRGERQLFCARCASD